MSSNHYSIIMAGGVGSRFWPMSTQQFPKQFQDILGTGRTMIQQTYDRISKIIAPENIFVITNKEYAALTAEQLPAVPASNIVGEPSMRNTAACNIYMAHKIAAANPDAVLTVLPADHLILKEDVFLQKMQAAMQLAASGNNLVTLGITPTRPDTGYGYIQFVKEWKDEYFPVKTFTEKPNLEIAKSFLESGDFLWNAGIFIWSARSILNAFEKHLPDMARLFAADKYNNAGETAFIEEVYPKANKISIDNGILEQADNVFVIPADLGWSDLGTWTSVYENADKDNNGSTIASKNVLCYNAASNVVRVTNKNKAVVIDGLENYIIVDTDKALLICPRTHDQLIKEYVQDLKGLKKGETFI